MTMCGREKLVDLPFPRLTRKAFSCFDSGTM